MDQAYATKAYIDSYIVWLARQKRLLTKERLKRLQVPVNEDACCLCEEGLTELREELSAWLGIQLQRYGVRHTTSWINRKHWRQLKKEVIMGT